MKRLISIAAVYDLRRNKPADGVIDMRNKVNPNVIDMTMKVNPNVIDLRNISKSEYGTLEDYYRDKGWIDGPPR